MKRGVRLENVFLASFYIPLKAFLYKKNAGKDRKRAKYGDRAVKKAFR